MWNSNRIIVYIVLYTIGWYLHMRSDYLNTIMLATMLRYLLAWVVVVLSKIDRFAARTRIIQKNPPANQYEEELDWDHAFMWSVASFIAVDRFTPLFQNAGTYLTWPSIIWCLLAHFLMTEPLYYVFHRFMHVPAVYKITHYHHHRSIIPQPISGTSHPWLENIGYMVVFSVSFLVPALMGVFSYALLVPYLLTFDLLNMIGHLNYECMPYWWVNTPLKYLIYTTSYHSLHHTRFRCNYVLFSPIWDYIGGSLHADTWTLFKRVHQQEARTDVVFMAHAVGFKSYLHTGFFGNYQTTLPVQWKAPLDWILFPIMFLMKTIITRAQVVPALTRCRMDGRANISVWGIPHMHTDYLDKSQQSIINGLLVRSIRKASDMGSSYVGLGAFNKARFLNAGGEMLRSAADAFDVKLVHGNTLTAAIAWESIRTIIPRGSRIVMTGGTSSIGEALVRLLAQDGYFIVIVSTSDARFQQLLDINPNLRRVHNVREASGEKWWCLGKVWSENASTTQQLLQGAHVLDWAEPSLDGNFHRLCDKYYAVGRMTYDRKRMDNTLCFGIQPGTIPACFAALIIHYMEKSEDHELGPLPMERQVYKDWLEKARKYSFACCVSNQLMKDE